MKTTAENNRSTRTVAATAAIALALQLALFAPAAAQTEPPADPEAPPLSAQDLSETQIEAFAAAASAVGAITEELQAEAQGVQDEAERARLEEEANARMLQAVEAEGLTVAEYNTIFQIAQVDQDLNARVIELMEE